MVSVEFTLKGAKELAQGIEKYKVETLAKVDGEIHGAGLQIERIAKDLAPIDTGRLRASIHTIKEKPLEVSVADNVEYGIYQEMGFVTSTGRFVQNPFLIPAYMQVKPELERRIGEILQGK